MKLTEKQIDLARACAKIKELKLQQEELKKQIEVQENILKEEMQTQNTDTLILGVFKVTWKSAKRVDFDKSSFQKEHSDLFEQYKKETEYKTFRIN